MDAKELRIGNYALFGDDKELATVASIEDMDGGEVWYRTENSKSGFGLCSIKEVEPVPLTPPRFKDFGFECMDITHMDNSISKGVFKKYPALIELNRLDEGEFPYGFCRIKPGGINEWSFFCYIRYAHHLQNVYFDFTGIELTKKEGK